ncbi:MAG: lysostaphin resistance A-like protein [Oscillospiraceae bacterium]
MEPINTGFAPQITVIPDKAERREIRSRYNKAALVLIINTLLFNIVLQFAFSLIFKAAGVNIYKDEFMRTLYSCLVPILSETVSIFIGIKLFKLKFTPMITRNGYGGGTVAKLITLCIGLQTAAALLSNIITLILKQFGLEGKTIDLSATTSLPANLFMYFYACLLGPVLEELLYRGVLLQSMRKYNERFAIFLSAVIFGLMHQNYQQFLLGFLVGIPLAVVTIKYGSLLPAILTHIVMNTTSTVTNCLIQYTSPELYDSVLKGGADTASLSGLSTAGIAVLIFNTVFRYGFMIAAIAVGIVSLVKGKNMSRPTPAGKARTWPVFVTAALWWVVFASYAFLSFVYPFII